MASTTKLFTAGAALTHLGAEATLTTRLLSEQPPDSGGVLPGDLIIVGGGDPLLGDEEFLQNRYGGRGTSVERLVDAVTAAGVRRIQGSVVGDGTLYVREEEPARSVTALSFNQSTQQRPVLFAAQRISEALEAAGVAIDGSPAARRTAGTDLHTVGEVESLPILDLLTICGHESDNVIAATLAKRMSAVDGARGSTRRGTRMIERHARDLGASISVRTASGLGLENLCAPEAITAYLVAMDRSPLRESFERVLPRAGADGTLQYRMRNTRAAETVRAKTGTLTGRKEAAGRRVRHPLQDSLAGYCRGRKRSVAFAFVYERAEDRAGSRVAIDRMVQAVARYCG
jgi:D-alanyl-D-alanine carboxypeptidase